MQVSQRGTSVTGVTGSAWNSHPDRFRFLPYNCGTYTIGQDNTRDARLLADEWTQIRRERTRLLAETDHLALSDQTLTEGMTTHRQKLRDIPTAQGSATKYSEITWPTKP